MQLKTLALVVAAACSTVLSVAGAPRSGPVEFRAHDIEPKFPGGYAVQAVDINKDGKLDVIGVSQRVQELAWYENPTWERHVMTEGTPGIVNFAAADLDGDGRKALINAPLIGAKSLAPTYDQDKAPLFFYRQGDWKRQTITNDVNGIIHRGRPGAWDGNRRDQSLVTSFDGITLYRANGRGNEVKWEAQLLSPGHNTDKAPRLGTSDVAVGKINGKRFMAAVEPWHGSEIVVYTDRGGKWQRKVIFDGLTEGHEVAVADLNGDGEDDIVAGDRSGRSPAVHVMYAPADPNGEWQHQVLDQGA